jgi:putative GTP pyrophosphokinase
MKGPLALMYSKSHVDRAADTWRAFIARDPLDEQIDLDGAADALQVIDHYRACHAYPLQKATVGLRSSVLTERLPVAVSQRHKRFMTILDKLAREPSMKLSRMQDIGGCRAVLPDIRAVRAVQQRLERRRGYVRTVDYIDAPRPSGYRGVHVMLRYDERVIEVQLRTQRMHDWAIVIERLGGRLHLDIKSGNGPPELLEFFRLVALIDQILESGEHVTDEVVSAVTVARVRAIALIEEMEAQR